MTALKGVAFRTVPVFAFVLSLLLAQGMAAGQARAADWVVNISDTGYDPTITTGTVVYSVSVQNDDVDTAPANTVSLSIPSGMTFTGTGSTDTITGCASVPPSGIGPATVTCNVPALAGGVVATLRASVKATSIVAVSQSFTVATTVPTLGVDRNPANNTASQSTTILAGTDISLSVAGPATLQSGGTGSYVFTVTNRGPVSATGVEVTIPKPTGLDNITKPANCTLTGSNYICTISGTMAVNGTSTLTFSGQISLGASSTVPVIGSLTNSTPPDGNASNNTASIITTVTPGSDVTIVKTRTPTGALYVGGAVNFVLTPSYTGDVPNTLTITDTVPSGYEITGHTATGWNCAISGQTVTCTRPSGTVAGNAVSLGSITIITRATTAGTSTNTASIASAGPADPNLTNNSSSVAVTVTGDAADLEQIKTSASSTVVEGGFVSFDLSVKNNGPRPFAGKVVVTENIPAGLELRSTSLPAGWSCSSNPIVVGPAVLTCERTFPSSVPFGSGLTTSPMTFEMRVTAAGTINNCATVSSPNPNFPDPNPANDTACKSVTTTPASDSADIQVFKRAQLASLPVYDIQTFDIEVTNQGPRTATNVTLTDRLSDLFNYNLGATGAGTVSISATAGSSSGVNCSSVAVPSTARDLTCTIASLPVCTRGVDCPIVTVQIRPGGAQTLLNRSNSATATSADVPEPNLGNNTATATYTVTPRANLRVTKAASPSPATAGQNLTYTINVVDLLGYSNAAGVTLTDTLPHNVRLISVAPPSGGSCSSPVLNSVTGAGNDAVTCSLGTINANTSRTVTVVVRPLTATAGTNIVNTVTGATTTAEADAADNTASVSTSVRNPVTDLQVNKYDSVDPVGIGTSMFYTLRAQNNGPSDATNVVITDTLPASGLSFSSLGTLPPDVTCSQVPAAGSLGGTLKCSIPLLAAGVPRDILVNMQGVSQGFITNTASIVSTESQAGFDPNPDNNAVSENTTVKTRVDLAVPEKSSPTGRAITINDPFNWTIRVTNSSSLLAAAEDVQLSDTLPAGMELTGTPTAIITAGTTTSNSCTGTVGGTSFVCSFGTLSAAGAITITAPVKVTAIASNPQTFSNTATVSTSSIDASSGNNSKTGTVSIKSSNISGQFFRDVANDGVSGAGDTGVSGVAITATGIAADGTPVTKTVNTDATGRYNIPGLPRGTYTVQRAAVSEADFVDGQAIPADYGTATNATTITGISVGASSATPFDFTLIPKPYIALSKHVALYNILTDGTIEVFFWLRVDNIGQGVLTNISIADQLSGAFSHFGTATSGALTPGTYSASADDIGSCLGATLNPAYDGSSDTLVANGISLPATGACQVGVTVRFLPDATGLAEISAGNPYLNQASATADGYAGMTASDLSNNGDTPDPALNDPTPFLPDITPAVGLVKPVGTYHDLNGNGPDPGDTITYEFTVTNLSDRVAIREVAVTDPKVNNITCATTTLDLSQTTTCSGDPYVLTAADVSAGQVENQATATAKPPYDTSVSDLSDPANTGPSDNSPTITPLPAVARLGIAKAVTSNADEDGSGTITPGDTLTYTVTATNTGTLAQTNVVVTDSLLTPDTKTCLTLAPGATCVLTGTYKVVTADADAGQIVNTAEAVSTEVTTKVTTTLTTPVTQTRSLSIDKVVDKAGPVAVGETLSYTITVANTGNTTQTNVVVTDSLLSPASQTCATLLPNATCVLSGTHVVTTADAEAGTVDNTAQAVSTQVTTPVTDSTSTPVTQTRSLSIDKVVDKAGPVAVGETLSYTITVANTGNTTQTNVVVTDSLLSPASQTCASLAPLATCVLSGTHVVTTADAEAGTVDNTAQAVSTEVTTPVTDSTSTPVIQEGKLSLLKSVNTTGPVRLGDTLTYTLTATNSGLITLHEVKVSDALLWPAAQTCGSGTLAPGTSCEITGTYVVTQADVEVGKVDNIAVAHSTEVVDSDPASTTTPVLGEAELTIGKVVDTAGPAQIGDKLTYTVTATNSGDTTQSNVVVKDPLITPDTMTCATVPPDGTCVLVGTHVVTAAEAAAGKVSNTAQAASDDVTQPVYASTTTPVTIKGDLNDLSKTALVATVRRGEKVPYVIEALNVSVSPARIVDVMPPGFAYVTGSATVNGKAVQPVVDGRSLTFDGLKPTASGVINLRLTLIATAAVKPGEAVNRADLVNPATGDTVSTARARITVLVEAVFDCGGIIGKVFDDKNHNGYQDEGEAGLPGVRIATVRGLLVTTDPNGRFHLACADLPDSDIGTNFVMKLDTRTLPTGYHVTSENPRRVRLTAGKVVKLNFGAALTRLVALDINDKVFEAGTATLKPKWDAGLGQVIAALAAEPSVLKITYTGKGDKLAKERVRAVTRDIKKRWQSQGPPYPLEIETRLVAAGGEGGQ